MAKLCLCEGLVNSVYLNHHIEVKQHSTHSAICPGPNLAWFSRALSLDELVQHIYGNIDLLPNTGRPNMFINELNLYVAYLKKDVEANWQLMKEKKMKYFTKFKQQLELGIQYYHQLIPLIKNQTENYKNKMLQELKEIELNLSGIKLEMI